MPMTDNERLCQWLGIEGEIDNSHACLIGRGPWRGGFPKCNCGAVMKYPDLSTRDGFWLMWDALPEPPHSNWNLVRRGKRGDNHAYLEGFPLPGRRQGEIFVEGIAATPWAALFAAAVALMDREERDAGPV